MEMGCAIFKFMFVNMLCYMIYNSIPNKYTKLEESIGGFINRILICFEHEKSPYILWFMVELVQVKLVLLGDT